MDRILDKNFIFNIWNNIMKSLYNYIKEAKEINISKSIDYNQFSELFLFINNSKSLMDRMQSICDTYRKKYNDSLSSSSLKTSIIFNKFIDDVIEEYNKINYTNKISPNIGTKQHLIDEIAAKMITKINIELDKVIKPEDESNGN